MAFITHAGIFSMTEGLYHQIPMVALPIFADQLDNAERIEHQGYGLTLTNQHYLKSDEIKQKVEEVVYNPRLVQGFFWLSGLLLLTCS